MKIIGITGGIGTGKSVVCRVFKTWGVPVFDTDTVARASYRDPDVKKRVIELLGRDAYLGDSPDFRYISSVIFSDQLKLRAIESIVHPWVSREFTTWLSEQRCPYVIREAAILIESGSYRDCAEIVVISAPVELRLKWIKARNGWSDREILERMSHQMTDDERRSFASRTLINDNEKLLTPVLWNWHQEWSGSITD